MTLAINTVISAALIALAAFLAGKYPRIAGFVVALPLATLLVLPMAYSQNNDAAQLQHFALSILVAVPIVMFFLVPFVIALRYGLGFWASYLISLLWLVPGYFAHSYLVRLLDG